MIYYKKIRSYVSSSLKNQIKFEIDNRIIYSTLDDNLLEECWQLLNHKIETLIWFIKF